MISKVLIVGFSAVGGYLVYSGVKGILESGKGNSRKTRDYRIQEIANQLKNKKDVGINLSEVAGLSWWQLERKSADTITLRPEEGCFIEDESKIKHKKHHISSSQNTELLRILRVNSCLEEFKGLNSTVKSFFYNDVVPFLSEKEGRKNSPLVKNKTLKPLMQLLLLLSQKGNVPSVVGPATGDKDPSYALLRNVSLLDHSLNTAKIGMDILKKELPFLYELTPDKYLFIFLGHDIGKSVEKGQYSTGDHPIYSAQILNKIIPDDVVWKTAVLNVVKNHHIDVVQDTPDTSSDKFDLWLLQTADRKAREKEIASSVTQTPQTKITPEDNTAFDSSQTQEILPQLQLETSAYQVEQTPRQSQIQPESLKESQQSQSDEELCPVGITLDEVLSRIEPLVNRVITAEDMKDASLPIPPETSEGNFVAFSQPDGLVYTRPDVIYQAFLLLVGQKGLQTENASLLALQKPLALRHLVTWLLKNGCLPQGHVKPGYIGRYYAYDYAGQTHKALFTPILAHAFGKLPGDFEVKRQKSKKVSSITNICKTVKKQRGGINE
ncbi:MAG: HD domain-containing protein [Candidatus Desulfofervidaceae bacterium]|nr:HD domain-containing protein [Candidatus Desulfofervidaceae bacterium]